MKDFVLNCGSSSIKSQILETSTDAVLATVTIERIGAPDSILTAVD